MRYDKDRCVKNPWSAKNQSFPQSVDVRVRNADSRRLPADSSLLLEEASSDEEIDPC